MRQNGEQLGVQIASDVYLDDADGKAKCARPPFILSPRAAPHRL